MFTDKTALVTGGSRGIGREIAIALAERGAFVAINYTANKDAADSVVKAITDAGGKAAAYRADVASEADVKAMFTAVESDAGTVDILVNNAGITRDTLLMRMKVEDWDDVMAANLRGAFLCTRAATKGMMKRRYGKIINISSVVGFTGNPGQANYTTSKAGIIGFTKTIAHELASRGVRVNAVAPGFIATDMTHDLDEKTKEAMLARIPLGTLGQAKDVANATIYLASPESDYMTGQVLHVNGGMYM